jgi:D,D-heptose 1,7-bisphosphate phosphatase
MKKLHSSFGEKIDIVILAGGKGSRIKKLINNCPKPLARINKNKTFLDYLLNNICKYNINKIFILAGYKGNKIYKAYHGKNINLVPVKCIVEKKPLGTAGSLLQIKKKISKKFMIINGDTIFDINFDEFKNNKIKKDEIFIALSKSNYKSPGARLYNLAIRKKRVIFKKNSKLINAGIYLVNRDFLKNIKPSTFSLENEIIFKLINQKKAKGKIYNNFFLDIGTPKTLKLARKILPKYFYKPALFLDRDGTLNHYTEGKYIYKFRYFKFKTGTVEILKKITKNFYLFLVTNQAGIGKNIFTENDFINLHKKIKEFLTRKNVYINEIKFCPFHPLAKIKKYKKNSLLRKPGNLMVEQLKKDWEIDFKKSYMIGDKRSDELCAKKSKLRFLYVNKNLQQTIKYLNYKMK